MNLRLQFVLRYLYPKSGKNSFSSNASILAIIGLSIGLFSLILTLSIIKGFENVLDEKLSSIDGKVRVQNILGKSILAVVNLPPRQIGSFMSEVLVLGLEDENQSIVLIAPEANVPNGSKLK